MPAPRDGTYLNTITRGGRTLQYLRISAGPQRDRYVHQLVAEAMLGRPLRPDEEVDHQDTNTLNNDWQNLVVRTVSEHAKVTRTRAGERRRQQRRQASQEQERAAWEAYEADRIAREQEQGAEDLGYTPECPE